MKNNCLIFFCLLTCSLTSSYAQVGTQDQHKPIISKATATWCNICGADAWDAFHDLIDTYDENAIFIAVHADDASELYNSTAEDFADNFIDFFGVPELYHGRDPAPLGRRWDDSTKEYIEAFNTQDRTTQLSLTFDIKNNNINVEANIKFLQDQNTPHYYSLLVIENDVIGFQFNRGTDAIHSKILRTQITPNVFDNLISEDNILANQEFALKLSKELNEEWNKENIEVVVALWKKFGDDFQLVNSSIAKIANTITHTNESNREIKLFDINPTILTNQSELILNLKSEINYAQIGVYNLHGQKILQLYQGSLRSGIHNYKIDRSQIQASGIYFVKLIDGEFSVSKKFIVQ